MAAPLRIAFLTHEPFFPPSGGGSAEAIYLVQEMVKRGHEVHVFGPIIPEADKVEQQFGITLHPFKRWAMGRYTKLRNFKYLAYPLFLAPMVAKAARQIKFDLVFSQHAIAAVAAGRLRRRLGLPVVMNFPDLLTGFMETWPSYVVPRPVVHALMNYEISLPLRYNVEGVCAISDKFASRLSDRGYPSSKICPIYYGFDGAVFPLRPALPQPAVPAVVVMHGSFDTHHLGPIALTAVRWVTARKPGTVFRFVGRRTAGLEKFLLKAGSIPGFKSETTGFVPYQEVAQHLASAHVGIVPYEASAGAHCAFVAKLVEYVAVGLPSVCTSLDSVRSYFKTDPMVEFASFEGEEFGRKIVERLEAPISDWQTLAATSSARVRAELDWQPLCRKAVDFAEKMAVR